MRTTSRKTMALKHRCGRRTALFVIRRYAEKPPSNRRRFRAGVEGFCFCKRRSRERLRGYAVPRVIVSRPIDLRRSNKKRPELSDRFVLADKTNCTGGTGACRAQWAEQAGEASGIARSACATMRVPRVIQTKTPPEEAIKKRPDISDRFVSADKTDCTGGVYRVSFSSLDARRSGGSQAPLGPDSLPPILAL